MLSKVWSVLEGRSNRRPTDPYVLSSQMPEPSGPQSPYECLVVAIDKIMELTSTSLVFNHCLWKNLVTQYLIETQSLVKKRESEITIFSKECYATLIALLGTVQDVEALIHKHCLQEKWVEAAVELSENTFAFAEVILDLRWYSQALNIAIEIATSELGASQQKVQDLRASAMVEYGTFFTSWESKCKEHVHKDRNFLLSKLDPSGKSRSTDQVGMLTLEMYLAKKLRLRESSSQAVVPLNINLDVNQLFKGESLRFLGMGAYAPVWAVTWLGMECAVKVIKNGGLGTEDGEVKILSELHHPNVVQLYGYHVEEVSSYIFMELMDTNLCELITAERKRRNTKEPFSLLLALDIMLQIAKGMCYLHSKGMAHRDLKSANILTKRSSKCQHNYQNNYRGYLSVKLTDFGMAKANLRNSTYTPQSWNIGTRVYKAPELYRLFYTERENGGRKYYPFKADVYSFGIVCSEILSGDMPFANIIANESTSSFYARIKGGGRPDLPMEVTPWDLASFIKQCWDTNPLKRPDFASICKRLRHFRDVELRVDAYRGCEHTLPDGMLHFEDPCITYKQDFIDTHDWDWILDYGDIALCNMRPRGDSGFDKVFQAQFKGVQLVLVKYINVTLIDRDASIAAFKEEMEVLVKIRHPNLVHYLGATQEHPFVVVTELYKATTLRQLLEDKRPLPEHLAVKIALHVACGMKELHGEHIPIIHGELASDCILLDDENRDARVADFGLRKFKNLPAKWQPRSFRAAPEQHLGQAPLQSSSDVFSFGMILYEMFEPGKAHRFWRRKRVAEELSHGARPPLASAPSYPKGMKLLIEKCWLQNPQNRPSFESLVVDLERMNTVSCEAERI